MGTRLAVDGSMLAELAVPDPSRKAIALWLDTLASWNARMDLTAARSSSELCDLMLGDALAISPHVAPGARLIDVGTGSGAPGLALALLRPDLEVTLVEPLTKRAAFLRTVLGMLERRDIELLRERGEDVAKRAREGARARWDVATSRATLPPGVWIPLGLRLAPSAWAFFARETPPAVGAASVDLDVEYTWPRAGAARRAVRYVRGDSV